jgi:hypothetical protein
VNILKKLKNNRQQQMKCVKSDTCEKAEKSENALPTDCWAHPSSQNLKELTQEQAKEAHMESDKSLHPIHHLIVHHGNKENAVRYSPKIPHQLQFLSPI